MKLEASIETTMSRLITMIDQMGAVLVFEKLTAFLSRYPQPNGARIVDAINFVWRQAFPHSD